MPATLPVLSPGSSGNAVALLRHLLSARGFHSGSGEDFDAELRNDLRTFQASENLDPDGVCGSLTWARLVERDKTPAPVSPVLAPDSPFTDQIEWLLGEIPADIGGVERNALVTACHCLGLAESPKGSNGGPEIEALVGGYNEYWKLGHDKGLPWCAMFVSSCIAMSLGLPANPTWGQWEGHPFYNDDAKGGAFMGGVTQIEQWAKALGKWSPIEHDKVEPGMLFTMSRGGSNSDPATSTKAGHVGFVVCDNGDGTFTTIEGNVSDKVWSHRRQKSSRIRGTVRWW